MLKRRARICAFHKSGNSQPDSEILLQRISSLLFPLPKLPVFKANQFLESVLPISSTY